MEVDSPPGLRCATQGDSPTKEPTKDPAQLIGVLLLTLYLTDEQKIAWIKVKNIIAYSMNTS
jgi:hypothetical protein